MRLCGHNVGLAVVTKLSKALRQVQLKMGHLQIDTTRCPRNEAEHGPCKSPDVDRITEEGDFS